MNITSEEFKQLIYDLANGSLDTEHFPIPESEYVKNEYKEGSFCERKYAEVLDRYTHLCQRLNVPEWEDDDIEVIIDNLRDIGEHISKKMFEYGVFFAKKELAEEKAQKPET